MGCAKTENVDDAVDWKLKGRTPGEIDWVLRGVADGSTTCDVDDAEMWEAGSGGMNGLAEGEIHVAAD